MRLAVTLLLIPLPLDFLRQRSSRNLANAIRSAAYIGNWPAVVRYVEMSRSAVTYQEERFESEIVGFVDVITSLLGADTMAERLLHDGRPTMAARPGLQMCAALDAMGAVPPWPEYMLAFIRESKDDNTSYGEDSDRAVYTAWLRGRLRLASFGHTQTPGSSDASAISSAQEESDHDLYAPINWERLAKQLDENHLLSADVVEAILDTLGLRTLVELIDKLHHPGSLCLALAEAIAARKASDSAGSAFDWAERAAECGLPPGSTSRLISIGVDVGRAARQPVQKARECLLDLTREVQERSVRWETGKLGEWMDACAIAAINDPLGLAAAEALLEGPGWYTCWLRFTIALLIAEVGSPGRTVPVRFESSSHPDRGPGSLSGRTSGMRSLSNSRVD